MVFGYLPVHVGWFAQIREAAYISKAKRFMRIFRDLTLCNIVCLNFPIFSDRDGHRLSQTVHPA